jgi:hypothetical protein
MCFEESKRTKKYQEDQMEEIQARSRGHKNRTVWFWIPKYLIFLEQMESN